VKRRISVKITSKISGQQLSLKMRDQPDHRPLGNGGDVPDRRHAPSDDGGGAATTITVGFTGSYYGQFVRRCLVPSAFILLLGTLYIIFGNELSFLIGG